MARFLLLMVGLLLALTVRASTPESKPDFSGSFVLAGKRPDRTFFLGVELKDRHAKVNFSASMADGSGASPDAEGTGKVTDGALNFKFTDSFGNEGTCKLRPLPGSSLYQLDMVVTKVVDPAPLHFYGTLQLKKTAQHPAPTP